MFRPFLLALFSPLAFALPALSDVPVIVALPAQAGAVDGTSQNSDEFIWRTFADFAAPASAASASPVVFETWASDGDLYTANPQWPATGTPKVFQESRLQALKAGGQGTVHAPCKTPGNAAVGGFPSSASPLHCIAEEVRRNRPQFDYIVQNDLYTQSGLKAAFAKDFTVVMPDTAISIKGDWVPVPTLLEWLPQLGSPAGVEKLYYTTTVASVDYALVSLHVSSRQNANWVWGTFEHQMNPGRCDFIGCFDSFGAVAPAVYPNRLAINTQYGACDKSPALAKLMAQAKLSPVWSNYCLKATQVDYATADGTPFVLGNSVIEGIVGNGTISASSCIACHAYAAFGADGAPAPAATAMLPFNPTGSPQSAVLKDAIQYDFMWGLVNAPP